MKIQGKKSNWPYVAILVCLFALSVTAPRHWRYIVRGSANRHETAARHTNDAAPLPVSTAEPATTAATISSPTAAPATQQSTLAATMVDVPTLTPPRVSDSPEPSLAASASLTAEFIETPKTLVNSPRPKPAEQSPVKPTLVSAADKITQLATIDPLPRSDHSPTVQPLLVQPPVAHDPGGIADSHVAAPLLLPQCVSLIEQLEEIDINGICSLWAYEVIDLLEQLTALEADDREAIDDTLDSLREVVTRADRVIEEIDDPGDASQLRHARYALLRRLDLWQPAVTIDLAAGEPSPPEPAEIRRRISRSVEEVTRAAKRTTIASSWERYLLLDELRLLASASEETDVARRRLVARRVLSRTENLGLDSTQQRFVESEPVESLRAHLQHWATEEIDVAALLADVERFEQVRSPEDARRVAQNYQHIRWSPSQAERDLAGRIEEHYRNANVRLAVTDRFLNLMLPRVEPQLGTVNDNILGNPVRGRRVTTTQLRIRFLPSHRRLRFALEAHGEVHSRTTAMNSRATLHNRGISRYRAGKLMQVGPRGMRLWPAVADVQSSSELEDVETEYDGTLFSSIAKKYARDQHSQMHAEAMAQVDRKVRREATRKLDAQVDGQIKKFKAAFATHVLDPLTHLSLKPQPIQLVTTKQRMVSRVRLATVDQLAAFTPRPRAPRDSLLSLQVHESAPGNIIEQLDLNGRTFTLRELYQWLHKKTGRTDRSLPADIEEQLPEDVSITFADRDAARVRFEDGHVEVRLNIKQLVTPGRRLKNFTVKASYEPGSDGVDATLVRRDAVSLSGRKKINMRGQIVLRGIFGKVFSKNRPIHLLGKQFSSRPGLENVTITQMVVRNGWIAVAIGPHRHAKNAKPRPVVAQNAE